MDVDRLCSKFELLTVRVSVVIHIVAWHRIRAVFDVGFGGRGLEGNSEVDFLFLIFGWFTTIAGFVLLTDNVPSEWHRDWKKL